MRDKNIHTIEEFTKVICSSKLLDRQMKTVYIEATEKQEYEYCYDIEDYKVIEKDTITDVSIRVYDYNPCDNREEWNWFGDVISSCVVPKGEKKEAVKEFLEKLFISLSMSNGDEEIVRFTIPHQVGSYYEFNLSVPIYSYENPISLFLSKCKYQNPSSW